MEQSLNDNKCRCAWSNATAEFISYHDQEWSIPCKNDHRLFEKICLESFQSGLSWRTILAKRDNFRAAFVNFDFTAIARFTQADVERLLQDKGIVRHRGKIEAVINNAKQAQILVKEQGSLAAFFWSFEPNDADVAQPPSMSISETSINLSKVLKKRGWKFVGPTTVFAFMQTIGLINAHEETCFMRKIIGEKRRVFLRPIQSQ